MEEVKTGVFKINSNKPIYIIGDIHGDYQCLVHCLVDLCGVVYIKSIEHDNKFNEPRREILEWKPNSDAIVVFCGDLIHRKRFQDTVLDDEHSDIYIIKTLFRLKINAQKNLGDIIIISGNHEIMNIIEPTESMYTSNKNITTNHRYFSSSSFINKYISNTYAWIKINDILIAHGGLCSDYLKFLDDENELIKNANKSEINKNIMIGGNILKFGDDIIQFINDKYRSFFTNYSKEKSKVDNIGHKLFIEFDFKNKHKHNVFWCRQWGYSGINCENFNKILAKVSCNRMIIAHCPQFLSNNKPKMINFECIDTNTNTIEKFKIARVDLGMSRSFEYNKQDKFIKFLSTNYNRKMSILKLGWDSQIKNYYFNYDSVITEKISCIQYLLIKYGITKKEWNDKKILSDWLGFDYINKIINTIDHKQNSDNFEKCISTNGSNDVILCLLYPIYFSKPELKSVEQFLNLSKFDELTFVYNTYI